MHDEDAMYLTPNGSGFTTTDIPLIHQTSDEPKDQPLGLIVWDMTWSMPYNEWRPEWAHEIHRAKKHGAALPAWAKFSSLDEMIFDESDTHPLFSTYFLNDPIIK